MEDWRTAAGQRYKQKLQGKRFKLPESDDNVIRPLPRKNADGSFGGIFWYEYQMHYDIGPQGRAAACGKTVDGGELTGDCWLCDDVIPKLMKSEKRSQRERAAAMQPKEQFGVQIAYLDDDGNWRGPVLWNMPTGGRDAFSTKFLSFIKSGKNDWISLRNGFNLHVSRTGTGKKDTRYGPIVPDQDPTPVPKEIVQRMKTFEELAAQYDIEQQKAAYFGREVGEDEDEDEGYAAGGNRRGRRDEDDDDPPVDDYPDEVPPSRGPVKQQQRTPSGRQPSNRRQEDDDYPNEPDAGVPDDGYPDDDPEDTGRSASRGKSAPSSEFEDIYTDPEAGDPPPVDDYPDDEEPKKGPARREAAPPKRQQRQPEPPPKQQSRGGRPQDKKEPVKKVRR